MARWRQAGRQRRSADSPALEVVVRVMVWVVIPAPLLSSGTRFVKGQNDQMFESVQRTGHERCCAHINAPTPTVGGWRVRML